MTPEEQEGVALRILRGAQEMGYARVVVEVTRGGTLRVDVAREDKAVRPSWGSGRGVR